jgi:hypothetical protein
MDYVLYEVEKRITRKLSPYQIAEAFPECIYLAKRKLQILKIYATEWEDIIDDVITDYKLTKDEKDLALVVIHEKMKVDPLIQQIDFLEKYLNLLKPKSNSVDIEKARNVPILGLYSFEKIKKTGQRTFALCPFHNERTPSFMIDKKNRWKCFSCQASGDSIAFIMKLKNLSFIDAVRDIT